ncbi:Uncharacterized protein dnm_076020 [Desulfonema magnum]|uniref:Uncharacterized protein n=1 Tax=Desulfonema magnum TaxID=45655 RepID=A0A975BUI7_9BACT|nr:Uncharacterized protein dnm_076020 [Desulfonema magnum]
MIKCIVFSEFSIWEALSISRELLTGQRKFLLRYTYFISVIIFLYCISQRFRLVNFQK